MALIVLFVRLKKIHPRDIAESVRILRKGTDITMLKAILIISAAVVLVLFFAVFGAMIMSFIVDWRASLIFLATIPLLCLVVFGIMGITIPLYKKVQGSLDSTTLSTRENLSGVRVIRAFGLEEAENARFHQK